MGLLTRVMGDPAAAAAVVPQLAHMNDVIKRFFATLTAVEAYEEGQGRRLLIGIVSTPRDLAENTQLRARDWFRRLEFEFLNAGVEFPGPPYRLSETPAQFTRPPRLGEHTEAVLAALG
jgi:benzylsuccinate CoA-transferase BbsE subunit